jgi:ComF family protein
VGLSSSLGVLAVELLASIVSPPRCAACDVPVPPLVAFCPACVASVEPDATAGPSSVAAYVYGGAIARSIARMKYQRRPDLARPLGDLLAQAVVRHALTPPDTLVVPVPLHPARLAERGYNQSALLARRVARACRWPMRALALARTRETPRQASLDRAARRENLSGAFRARQADRIRGRTVLLVDDVRTTGATLDACTSALLDAGATAVAHAVVARVQAGV